VIEVQYLSESNSWNTRYVLVTLGLGCISEAIANTSVAAKRRFKKLSYVPPVTIACLLPKPVEYKVQFHEGQRTLRAATILALNVPPANMRALARGCNANDGALDLVALQCENCIDSLALFARTRLGKLHTSRKYARLHRPWVSIELPYAMEPNIDGDPLGERARVLRLRTLPGALRLIVAA
jgi:diacylglycerol kinase family enzyme